VTKVAAISVQSVYRPATARPVTPASQVETPKAKAVVATTPAAAPTLAPQLQAFADLGAVIQLQAAHTDPQPTHGNDGQHGHVPADPPPVAQPPVAQPPVTSPAADPNPTHGNDDQHGHAPADPPPIPQPPVTPPVVAGDPNPDHGADDLHGHKPADPPPVVQPPMTPPPAALPRPVSDGTVAAGRALAILNQELIERGAIRAEGAAFTAYAAQRAAFAAVNRNNTATALLQAFKTYA
jgi:hypothetical protein